MIGVLDLFKIGIGPSSSHTVGPMRAAAYFVDRLAADGLLERTAGVHVDLYGSLAATGHGHGTIGAIVLGLGGEHPETVDPDAGAQLVAQVWAGYLLRLGGRQPVAFKERDIQLHLRERLDFHSNGMRFTAIDAIGVPIWDCQYYSIGGGFVLDQDEATAQTANPSGHSEEDNPPYPFASAARLLQIADRHGMSIADIVMANELSRASVQDLRDGVRRIWTAMRDCIDAGCAARGELPGGLKVPRRAAQLRDQLVAEAPGDPLHAMEWVTLAALAVNEQNAAGGRVVTAPTNGAAGIVPAVVDYYLRFVPGASDDGVMQFFLVATAIGALFKQNASISGAEVGCQGEVGSATAMAAAGLAQALGASPAQVEYAAEIGLEHNLGLTCDPVGGLVQIPCIERNAIGAVKAITAARMAIRTDGAHRVSLDQAIETMRRTGLDMHSKYKETARGGLALTLADVEC